MSFGAGGPASNLLAPRLPGTTFEQVALAAAIVGTGVFVIGFALSFLLTEPKAGGHGG